jgi:hypothetical protein
VRLNPELVFVLPNVGVNGCAEASVGRRGHGRARFLCMFRVLNRCGNGRVLMRSFVFCSHLQYLRSAFLDWLVHIKMLSEDLG